MTNGNKFTKRKSWVRKRLESVIAQRLSLLTIGRRAAAGIRRG